jgi:hypothetical protein
MIWYGGTLADTCHLVEGNESALVTCLPHLRYAISHWLSCL